METIRAAFMTKWDKVPLLETYRQMAIRQQKKKDWAACVRWTERGLQLYRNDAAREEAVEDLLRRRNRALAKLEVTAPAGIDARVEILVCSRCASSFERVRVRGRKPALCPECRSAPNVN
ncbi:zinc finger domain-containing protein [Jiangella mangrovi]|uniref:Putative Zn-ribbon and HTH transcriptional regulator n=1 Tax=Jiangella mangrovi TaxID=1524084 RepID=A0A7W9GNP0_9ACTN|nr:hypothetical protein [Jiangella mangrovi]MBB5787235.1 putative Zn-ribbon and HTH transcriptional regulator [Jiangella mangrovi]